jgi:hypothetical protein
MLILRAYYDPELAVGMTRAEVAARLPGILAGSTPAARAAGGTVHATRAPGSGPSKPRSAPAPIEAARIQAAERAVTIARNPGWDDTRLGFSFSRWGG